MRTRSNRPRRRVASRVAVAVIAAATGAGVLLAGQLAYSTLDPTDVLSNRLATKAFYANDIHLLGLSGSGMAFDGTNVWAVRNGTNNISKVNATTGAVVTTTPVGTRPVDAAFDGRYIWVANSTSNNLTKIDPGTGGVAGTFPVGGTDPRAIEFDGTYLWVAVAGNTVRKIRTDGTIVDAYTVGNDPVDLAYEPENNNSYMWVVNRGSNSVTKLRIFGTPGSIVGTYPVGVVPTHIAYDGAAMWVTNIWDSYVTKFNADTGAVIGRYAIPVGADSIAFDQPGYSNGPVTDPSTYMWITNYLDSSVTKLRVASGAVVATYPIGQGARSVVFDGTNIWVAQQNSLARIRAR